MAQCKFIVCVCAHPELMVFQVAAMRHFLKQSFDYCVVDDSKEERTSLEIRRVCEEQGYEYLRSPPHAPGRDQPSTRHADTLMYGFTHMSRDNSYTYIGTLDNDFFLISPLDLTDILAEKNILTVKHTREHIQYFWPGCCIWRCDSHSLENFHWDICIDRGIRADTGGTTYYYWRDNAENVKALELLEYQFLHIPQEQWIGLIEKYLPLPLRDFCIQDIHISRACGVQWWSDIYADPEGRFVFFHLRDVSNWQGIHAGYLRSKVLRFCAALNSLFPPNTE
jgi:hypothetical protein